MPAPDAATREEPTYGDLYRQHHARVGSLCRLLLRDPHEAEDVVQDVFLALHRQIQLETRPMVWGAWLTAVAVNGCRDRRRSGWWKLRRDVDGELVPDGLPGRGPSPEDEVSSLEQRATIWRSFRRLPLRQREVFALRLVEGWSTDEVAELLGVSPGSVKRHLSRAVHRLRKALGGRA
jgi:RNA polymerase sigma-70 factor (ECF subfamily)